MKEIFPSDKDDKGLHVGLNFYWKVTHKTKTRVDWLQEDWLSLLKLVTGKFPDVTK